MITKRTVAPRLTPQETDWLIAELVRIDKDNTKENASVTMLERAFTARSLRERFQRAKWTKAERKARL